MSSEQTPAIAGPTTTVTYAVRDRVWADWITEQLTKAGATIRQDRWQPAYDSVPLDQLVAERTEAGDRMLMVVTPYFFTMTRRPDWEWRALVERTRGLRDRFRPILVGQEAVRPPDTFWLMNPIRLYRVLDADVARDRLLRDLGMDAAAAARYSITEDQRRFPGNPPVLVSPDLPHRNPAFTGRHDLLDHVRDALTAPSTERMPVALGLHGLGGTGKTQLAIEYAHRFQNDYDIVWWIPARHRLNVRSSLKQLAVELGAGDGPDEETNRDDLNEQVRFALSRLRLGIPYSRWLVVFDDVAEDAIEDYLPLIPASETGHVIITTRDQNWREYATATPVHHFTREESRRFLKRRAPRLTDADAEALAEWAGDLPLALKQISAIAMTTGRSAAELIQLFEAEHLRVLGEAGDASYPFAVATTWLTALSLLEESYSHFAIHLLNTLAFFGGDSVPVAWFTEAPEGVLEPAVHEALRNPAMLNQSLRAIAAYSLADDPGGREPRLQMHQMVARFVREELRDDEYEEYQRQAQQMLAAADPDEPALRQNFDAYSRLVPHIAATGLAAADFPEGHRLIANCVRYLRLVGEFETCRRLAESAFRQIADGAPLEPWQFTVRRQHALSLAGLGQRDAAVEEDEELFERLKADPEADQGQLLNVASGLAGGLRERGRYAEAAAMSRDVLARRGELHADPSHPEVLRARHNAAIDLRVAGDYSRAMIMDRETLNARRVVLGDHHYQTLLTQSNVAGDLREMGRYTEAVALQEETYLAILDAVGPTSAYTRAAMIQLAICRRRAGQHQAAYDISAEVYQQCAYRFGDNHPDTVAAATNLAGECRALGRFVDGFAYAERAVAGARVLYPETHPYRAVCEANRATLLRSAALAGTAPPDGRTVRDVLDEVLQTDRRSAAVLAAELGRDHAYTLAVAVNLASDHAALGDYQEAVDLGRRTVDRLAAFRGADHPDTVAATVNLAADLEHVDPAAAAQRKAWLHDLLSSDRSDTYPSLSEPLDSRVICDLDLPIW